MTDSVNPAQLLQTYESYAAPRERWLVGGEYERAVVRADGRSVGYHDPDGIRWLLGELNARLGWKEKREGEFPIELAGEGASITLEPGGQVELSGAPFRKLSQLAAEVRRNRALLYDISAGHDLHWTACGLTPFANINEIEFVPKGRYRIMRDFLPQYGDLAHWMMKGTCCVQANFDYADEADCAKKFRVAMNLAPLNVALFANSPLAEGKETGWMSYRGHIWTRVDPRRTGFPANVRERYSHAGWIDYLLDAPMMFYKRDQNWLPSGGRTFRTWMAEGIEGRFPTADDWALHQTSVFPEVRVKRTIEIRSADAVPVEESIGFCALWTGILYGELDAADRLASEFAQATGLPVEAGFAHAARAGLAGEHGAGRSLTDWSRELLAVARAGLETIGEDSALLDPIDAIVASGRSPAMRILDAFHHDPSPANVLVACRY